MHGFQFVLLFIYLMQYFGREREKKNCVGKAKIKCIAYSYKYRAVYMSEQEDGKSPEEEKSCYGGL